MESTKGQRFAFWNQFIPFDLSLVSIWKFHCQWFLDFSGYLSTCHGRVDFTVEQIDFSANFVDGHIDISGKLSIFVYI